MSAEAIRPLRVPEISARAADMPRSSIRRLFNAAKALEAQGVDVYRLDIGDPDFAMPDRMSKAISAALARGETHYSPMPGIPELRAAITAHASRQIEAMSGPAGAAASEQRSGRQLFSAAQVVASQGATQALNACMQLCCERGGGVLLPARAHAVNGDAALVNHLRGQPRRQLEGHPPAAVAQLALFQQLHRAVDMPLHKVAAEALARRQRQLQVDALSGRQRA